MAKSSPLEGAQQIQEMLVTYAKQETVEPLKTLGRYLGFGVAGSLLMGLGVLFAGLATLRLTQTFSLFSGSSWASMGPYALALAVLLLSMVLIYLAMSRAKKKVLS